LARLAGGIFLSAANQVVERLLNSTWLAFGWSGCQTSPSSRGLLGWEVPDTSGDRQTVYINM
jgi:hypothetical protein